MIKGLKMEKKFTIVLNENNQRYKVTKIAFYRDGGFGIFVPYHSSKRGILTKLIIDYRKRESSIKREDVIEYTADDQVKLSFHPDGFVQFSGIHQNIISGRDESGRAKGLGIYSNPLNRVIKTGPTCGSSIWGLKDFQQFTEPKRGEEVLEFNEIDYYYRDCAKDDWNGYTLELFLFELDSMKYIKELNGNKYLMIKHNNYMVPGFIFKHRVVPFNNKDYLMTLIVSRTKFSFESRSRFSLNSPSQLLDKNKGIILMAVYPPYTDLDLPKQNLNYNANSGDKEG
ncbi:MAG: hypothetical protein WA144_16340 [Candidatus Methanoperedens sp.]